MLAIVHTEGDETGIKRSKFLAVTRELAQLTRAVGSPISAIKDQQHTLTALRCKRKSLAVFVLQSEIRRKLASCGGNLWSGQNLGCAER